VAFPQTDFDEHMIVELRNGRLWMLARTKYGMAETFSSDSGRTWTEPKPAAIQNVSARFFIRRLASGRLLLVKNGPIDHRLPKRSHMSAFLSDDDGKTWRGGLLLDERASVSYPDGFQAPDGLVHILYDWNRHTDAEILMAKFREEDVLAGKFISPDARPRILVNKALGPKPRAARVRVPSLGSNSKSSVSLFLGGLPWRRPSTSRSLRSSASPRTTCCGTAGEAKAVALELACRLAHGMRCNDAAEDRVSMNSREPSNDRNSFHGRCPPYADWSSRAVQRHL
jgi:hypothetical protein